MRIPLVAGNWKMNLDLPAGRALVAAIRDGLSGITGTCEAAICPPAIYLFPVAKAVAGSPLRFGAQNLYHEASGAFTGEISAPMVKETGARYVILGHSERRHTIGHHEDDYMINLKCRAAQRAGLTPIVCVGETLAQRDGGQTLDVLAFQLTAGILGLRIDGPDDLVIAYEPVWAIGTGRNATAEQAQEAHAHLRATLRRAIGAAAEATRILYGGSVKADNAAAIMRQPDVDGALVGGASLKAESFLGIIRATAAAKSR